MLTGGEAQADYHEIKQTDRFLKPMQNESRHSTKNTIGNNDDYRLCNSFVNIS